MYLSSYFRQAIAAVDANIQRFVTLPKQMLLRKYALTAYFGRQFAIFETPRLMYWLGLCNNLSGQFELVETRLFSKTHDNPRRRGARIVAFEGNQEFLDSLQRYPKDYPFNIRFGGNIYIRRGDRYVRTQFYNYTYQRTKKLKKKNRLILTQTLTIKNLPEKRKPIIQLYSQNNLPFIKPPTLPDVIQTIPMLRKDTGPGSTGPLSRSCLAEPKPASLMLQTRLKTTSALGWPAPVSAVARGRPREKEEEEEEEEEKEIKTLVRWENCLNYPSNPIYTRYFYYCYYYFYYSDLKILTNHLMKKNYEAMIKKRNKKDSPMDKPNKSCTSLKLTVALKKW